MGNWPLPDAGHHSSWSRKIMTHTATFHKKEDFKLFIANGSTTFSRTIVLKAMEFGKVPLMSILF